MNTEHWPRIRRLVETALGRPEGEREAFVERECAGDDALREEVLTLLAQEGRRAGWLEPPRGAFSAGALGRRVGAWELSREIGAGGMGTVYLAVRADRQFEQQVALKLLKRGMDTDELLERFQRERQVLAALEHPGIARLIDGGATEDGLPYIVMEYVEGDPIDVWCEARGLHTRERLALFRKVCDAVQYAHRNLVVHRDLKPSNVLVTDSGEPKLLDFGIAKLLDSSEPAITRDATAGARFLTPDYASPEQVRGSAVATPSDVYSLGALLYELLTGARPHRFTTRTPLEIETVVCEQDAQRPSAAVTSRALARELAGDLDTIVLKALHKEPERRYASVEQLSEDLRRYLANLPVTARPDSATYRLRKFVRRNRVPVGATVAVVAILVLALWNSDRLYRDVRSAWRAEEVQRGLAERRFEDVRELALQSVFDVAVELAEMPGTTELREQIVRGASERLDGLAAEAGDDHALWFDLARAYLRLGDVLGHPFKANLGQPERAQASYAQATAIAERLDAEGFHELEVRGLWAQLLEAQANVQAFEGAHEEALALYRRSLEAHTALAQQDPGWSVPLTVRRGIAEVLTVLGRFDEASAAFEEATAEARARWEADPTWANAAPYCLSLVSQAAKLVDLGRAGPCEELAREALAVLLGYEDELAGDPMWMRRASETHHYLGRILALARPRDPEGGRHLERALELSSALVARDPREMPARHFLARTLFALGDRHIERGENEQALEALRRSEEVYTGGVGAENAERRRELAIARDGIGKALYRLGRHEESVEVLEQVREHWLERVAAEPESARARRDLAVNAYLLAYPVLERVPEDGEPARIAAACEASCDYLAECLFLLEELDRAGQAMPPDRRQMEHVRQNLAALEDKLAGLSGSSD